MAIQIKSKSALDQITPYENQEQNYEKYFKNRDNFQTGDILFFSGNHWLSSLIRWRSKSAWSHIGIVIKIVEMNRLFLVESIIESGVRLLPLSFVFTNYGGDYKPYNGRVAWARQEEIYSDKDKMEQVKEFCLDNLTKQYDRQEYYRIVIRSFIGRHKIFHDDKYTCAEYVYEAFKSAGVILPHEMGVFISPGAFWRQKSIKMLDILI